MNKKSGDFEEPRRAAPTGAAMYVQCRLFEIKHACNLTKNKQAEILKGWPPGV
jgi:hypothetical protein